MFYIMYLTQSTFITGMSLAGDTGTYEMSFNRKNEIPPVR